MSLKLENTEKYLRQYTKSLLESVSNEISRKDRIREYDTRTINSPITASGKLLESFSIRTKHRRKFLCRTN